MADRGTAAKKRAFPERKCSRRDAADGDRGRSRSPMQTTLAPPGLPDYIFTCLDAPGIQICSGRVSATAQPTRFRICANHHAARATRSCRRVAFARRRYPLKPSSSCSFVSLIVIIILNLSCATIFAGGVGQMLSRVKVKGLIMIRLSGRFDPHFRPARLCRKSLSVKMLRVFGPHFGFSAP